MCAGNCNLSVVLISKLCLKITTYLQIRPHEMKENCFWIMANDGKYENADLLSKLELTFCCQKQGKRTHCCNFVILLENLTCLGFCFKQTLAILLVQLKSVLNMPYGK